MSEEEFLAIRRLLEAATDSTRSRIFTELRKQFPIHQLESKLNASAELILEAIHRASDLTLRGVRGVIAEAAFSTEILGGLTNWVAEPPGNESFDFQLRDKTGIIRIQVKLQRQKEQRPMLSEEAPRSASLPPGYFVVETQRTRSGKGKDGQSTRPYRFGEFDLLAVCLQPSSGNWREFRYTVANWLIPNAKDESCIQVYQPLSKKADQWWTDDLASCIAWFRSGQKQTLPRR